MCFGYDEQLTRKVVRMGKIHSYFVRLTDQIEVLFCHKTQFFQVRMEVDPDDHGMFEFLFFSGKGRKKIIEGRLDEIQQGNPVDDSIEDSFQGSGNNGSSEKSHKYQEHNQ